MFFSFHLLVFSMLPQHFTDVISAGCISIVVKKMNCILPNLEMSASYYNYDKFT